MIILGKCPPARFRDPAPADSTVRKKRQDDDPDDLWFSQRQDDADHRRRERHRREHRGGFPRAGMPGRHSRLRRRGGRGTGATAWRARAFRAHRCAGHPGAPGRHPPRERCARPDHDPRQQRRPRRPPHHRRGDARILARTFRHQPRSPVLRHPGGAARHGEGGRRIGDQYGVDELSGERRFVRGLQDGEIGGSRADAGVRARTRAAQHPRQLPSCRAGS